MRSRISPAKYANTASGVIRSPLSATAAPRWICSRIRMSPAAQPSARVQARSTIAASPDPSSSAAASSRVKRKSSGADAGERLVRDQSRERGGRFDPADQDHVHPDRDLLQPMTAARASALPSASCRLSNTTHGAGGQPREELAEPAPTEAGEIAPVLVGEERQRRRLRAAERRCREAEKVEERRRIAVAGVDVVPDRVEPPRVEVARHDNALLPAPGAPVIQSAGCSRCSSSSRNRRSRGLTRYSRGRVSLASRVRGALRSRAEARDSSRAGRSRRAPSPWGPRAGVPLRRDATATRCSTARSQQPSA